MLLLTGALGGLRSPVRRVLKPNYSAIYGNALIKSPKACQPRKSGSSQTSFRAFNLNHTTLKEILGRAPKEATQPAAGSQTEITLPMPDGTAAAISLRGVAGHGSGTRREVSAN